MKTYEAGENIPIYRRLKLVSNKVYLADASEESIGVSQATVLTGEWISVKLWNESGTFKIEANETITANSYVYGADDGKISTDGFETIGKVITDTTDGSFVDIVLALDFDSGNSGYSVSGNTLTVTSVGGAGDRFATLQAAYDEVAVDDILGEPSATNNVWVEYKGINFEQSRSAVASVADVDGTDSTITTSEAHGLEAGDYVRLVGMSVADYDSEFRTAYEVLTVPTDTTFTIKLTYSATATGVAIKQGVLTTGNEYVGVIADSGVLNLVVV